MEHALGARWLDWNFGQTESVVGCRSYVVIFLFVVCVSVFGLAVARRRDGDACSVVAWLA